MKKLLIAALVAFLAFLALGAFVSDSKVSQKQQLCNQLYADSAPGEGKLYARMACRELGVQP